MTARELPPAEWGRLDNTDLAAATPHLSPTFAKIVVVEDTDGSIVGCWAAIALVHAEGVWIAPAHRTRGAVARRLWRQMRTVVASMGASSVLTAANTPEVARLLTRHGAARVAADTYLLPLKGSI